MANKERYLVVEAGDTEALVDFLDHNCAVRVSVVDGKVQINVKCSPGKDSSSWEEHDFEVPLAEQDDEDDDE